MREKSPTATDKWPKPTRRLPGFGPIPRAPGDLRQGKPSPPIPPAAGARLALMVDVRRAYAVACAVCGLGLTIDSIVVEQFSGLGAVVVLTAVFVYLSSNEWSVRLHTATIDMPAGALRERRAVTAARAAAFPMAYAGIVAVAQIAGWDNDAVFAQVLAAFLFRFAISSEMLRRDTRRVEAAEDARLYQVHTRGRSTRLWLRVPVDL